MDFVLAIAKGLLSSLGARIFASVFPSSAPNYFGEILTDIQQMLAIEAVSNDIVTVEGTVNGLITLMTVDYPNYKATGYTKTQLVNYLEQYVHIPLDTEVMGPLEELTGIATSKGNAQQSLLAYVFCGGMQLAVLQEMALQDPNASTPSKSAYAADLKAYAAKYGTRAQTLLTALKASRMADIQFPTPPIHVDAIPAPSGAPGGGSGFAPSPGYEVTTSFVDGWIGKSVCVSQGYVPPGTAVEGSPVWLATQKCGETYLTSQSAAFDTEWANATQTLAAWATLQTTPFPPPPDFILAIAQGLTTSPGEQIFTNVFPLGVPSYFAVILQQTENLMHLGTLSSDVTGIQGTVDGAINQMLVDYPKKQGAGATNQELITFLSGIKDTLQNSVMTPLQALADLNVAKGDAQQSLLAFVFCGGLLFAVLQEMALHDPQAATPGQSQYATEIKNQASQFAMYGQNLRNALIKSRLSSISEPLLRYGLTSGAQPAETPPVQSGEQTIPVTTYIDDGWLGTEACLYAGNYPVVTPQDVMTQQTAAAAGGYMEATVETFESDCADAAQMCYAWCVLQTDPVPGAAG